MDDLYMQAQEDLEHELGREPSTDELETRVQDMLGYLIDHAEYHLDIER